MSKRHQSIGIKQIIRLDWMQYTAKLLSEGENSETIRKELNNFLRYRKASNSNDHRGEQTRVIAVGILSRAWLEPAPELMALRDDWLAFARKTGFTGMAAHWGMISAAYPFWFNMAWHVGRLLNLQEQITHAQIVNRLKEQYGDKETVSRCARYGIRSLVAWGAIDDTNNKGCYIKAQDIAQLCEISATLMIESMLHAMPEGKCPINLLMGHPALFPFSTPFMSGETVVRHNPRIELIRHSVNNELLKLKH